ncbi:MAG: EpsI family protein [Bryobacterales bacterium]|nr:EpsI family protein [Bryobacteraceae bacterium]MDW8131140.1 EpsI family protein [Bryobacterales bacterium]
MPAFLRSRHGQILSFLLILQIVAFHAMPRGEAVPLARPFAEFPAELEGWTLVADVPIEEEVQALLKADETLNRVYRDPATGAALSLFVAFFRSQRAGATTHSPRVCLPGAGWETREASVIPLAVPGGDRVRVNRWIVSRDSSRSVVLYWFQTSRRVVANEYANKFYLMLDSLRYRRSDGAFVRIVSPVGEGGDAAAEEAALCMAGTFFAPLRTFLPQ